jgi:dCMP deaminase
MRPSWDEYFFNIIAVVKTRSTCIRRQVGAIVVLDKKILATGYNGAPKGLQHCEDLGCYRQLNNIPSGTMHEACKAVHAEQNIICQAAESGISLKGATLYTDTFPCSICSKLIINSGIVSIVVGGIPYPDELSKQILSESGIKIQYIGE